MTTPTIGIDATTWWNNRGFGRFTRELVRALIARQDRFRYTLVIDREETHELPSGIDVLPVPLARPVTEAASGADSRSPREMLSLSWAVARARFDAFFYPAVYSFYPVLGRTPCVVTFHDTIVERFPDQMFPTRRNRWLWNAKMQIAKRQATRVMTVSRASAEDLVKFLGVKRSRIDVVTEGADAIFRVLDDDAPGRAARAACDIPCDVPLLVYVGGLNPHKNLLGLLRAMPEALRTQPDLQLAIVGQTTGKGFHDNVAELMRFVETNDPLPRHVHFTGYLPDDDLVALFNDATALVLPSFWEGFGLAAVEAMSCGLPILASQRGSLPEVVGDAGLFFDPDSPADIARAIDQLLSDEESRSLLAERARPRAATFSWERGAELAELSFARCLEG